MTWLINIIAEALELTNVLFFYLGVTFHPNVCV